MSVVIRDRDHGYRALMSRLQRARNRVGAASSKSPSHRISIGIHGDEAAAIAYDGHEESITLVEVVAIQEYGLGVPERSFIRGWFDENRSRLAQELKHAEAAELFGNDPDAVTNLARRWQSEVRVRISTRAAGFSPLAASTIKQREAADISSETPLLATGQLVDSIRAMVDGAYV